MTKIASEFFRFIDRSPTSWHAAKYAANWLAELDFTPLYEQETWTLQPGKSYFVVRDDAALCAFRCPTDKLQSALLIATHLDSPSLKLKPNPVLHEHSATRFATELYGSPLLATWLDRDLAIAGRIFATDKGGALQCHLVFLDDYPLVIPSLALHLDRSIADKGLLLNKQEHLKPIATIGQEISLEDLLRKHVSFEELISYDLHLVPLEKASFLGFDSELIAAPRLDNFTSAFAALYALRESGPSHSALQLCVFWDHEEVGSKTYLGAESLFADQILERICLHQKIQREGFFQLKSRSLCISADLAHGLHPNYPDKYDLPNAPRLGQGVVLKMNAQQRYATSAETAARVQLLAKRHHIPLQTFASRSDIPSGSTVGPMMAAVSGIPTIDLGIAGWAMHSIRETVSREDENSLCQLLKVLLEDYA